MSNFRVLNAGGLPYATIAGNPTLVLCSNDYLGLSNDPAIKQAAIEALAEHGNGLAAGRTVSGTTELHIRLEKELAAIHGADSALLLTSAFTANVGLLTTILSSEDYVFSDQLNHASIVDGCRYSGAKVRVYPHRNMIALREKLLEAPVGAGKLIITDGVFSMEGDLAPLRDLVALKQEFQATLVVDDAHGVGVLGKNGRGTAEHFELIEHVDIHTGTLGKSLGGALGGYVAGSTDLIDTLIKRCRTFIFTNPIPASVAAASLAAIYAMRSRPDLRDRLWRNTRQLRSSLSECGFNLIVGETPIIPVLVGEDDVATALSEKLLNAQVLVQAFKYPVVPKGEARLRVIASAAHHTTDVEKAVEAFAEAGKSLGLVN